MNSFIGVRCLFQSTLPRGSDAYINVTRALSGRISIHAPSRERPALLFLKIYLMRYFNPRSLAGATMHCLRGTTKPIFQSTLPRGSDSHLISGNISSIISIHAPSRERLPFGCAAIKADNISIHAPSRERPLAAPLSETCGIISIHAPSRERQKNTY